jgi:hypothetical protein
MANQFNQHYTRDQARALLPQIRQWLEQLSVLRQKLSDCDQRLSRLLAGGNDVGGETVNRWVRVAAEVKATLAEFQRREIQIKDLDRGLIDFPAFLDGQEVFLCWEQDEEDIEFWHDLHSGYAGRERL